MGRSTCLTPLFFHCRSKSGTPKHFLLVEKILRPRFLFVGLPLLLMGYGFLKTKTKEIKDDVMGEGKSAPNLSMVEAWRDENGVFRRLRPTDPDYAVKRAALVKVKADKLKDDD